MGLSGLHIALCFGRPDIILQSWNAPVGIANSANELSLAMFTRPKSPRRSAGVWLAGGTGGVLHHCRVRRYRHEPQGNALFTGQQETSPTALKPWSIAHSLTPWFVFNCDKSPWALMAAARLDLLLCERRSDAGANTAEKDPHSLEGGAARGDSFEEELHEMELNAFVGAVHAWHVYRQLHEL